jgi:hypothetical protein
MALSLLPSSRAERDHIKKNIICFLFSGVICLGVAALSLPLQSDASPPAYVTPLRFLRHRDISIAFAIKLTLLFG